MKSCIFLASYLNGTDHNGDSYFERYQKFLAYYRTPKIKEAIGFSDFVFVDNASDISRVNQLDADDVTFLRYDNHMPRGPIGHDYPFGWRMVWSANLILEKYDKIIFLDSDGFILTTKLAHWIKELSTGWTALWCPRHKFPEANLHVLTKDAYPHFQKYTGADLDAFIQRENLKCMEETLPFTRIRGDHFVADRFGEEGKPQTPDMDFYAQAWNSFKPTFS